MSGHNNTQRLRLFLLFLLLCSGVLGTPSPATAAMMPNHEAAAGVSSGPRAPTAIAHGRWGRFYVVETGANRLDIYDANGIQADRIEGLNRPLAVAISRRGIIYVGNEGDGSVAIYDKRTLTLRGKLGGGDGEFEKPTAIAIDKKGRIYVADALQGTIKVFSPKGERLFRFGSDGIGNGQFRHPVSLLIRDYSEEILVLDFGSGLAGRVQTFDLAGNFKRSFDTIGTQGIPLVKPIGMVMDEQQRLYISDVYSSQIAVYDSDGVYLGGLSANGAALHNPLGMSYDAMLGRLYIASLNNSRIVAFDLFNQRRRNRPPPSPPAHGTMPQSTDTADPSQHTASADQTATCRRNCTASGGGATPSSATYTLHATAGPHGRIEPAGQLQVGAGGNARFRLIPDPGYRIASVKLDGNPVAAQSEQHLADIRADHSLEVAFAPILEVGELQIDHNWTRITFNTPFSNPVVVAKLTTRNEPDPAVTRIRNLDQNGFEIRLQEWDYLDGIHGRERLNYLVMEQGAHKLPGGTQVEAGYFSQAMAPNDNHVSFQQPFSARPLVVTSVATTEEQDAVTGRLRKITPEGFDYRLQEQELNRRQHASEQIAYIAWAPSSGTLGGLAFEAAIARPLINHSFHPLAFASGFVQPPALLAEMQTANGGDPANLRIGDTSSQGATLRAEEEQSADDETRHAAERVGYLAFAVSLTENGTDYDGDGLTDADEVNTYGSSALARDSDSDGLNDGEEQRLWAAAWNLDHDADGRINLLDSDADNDGYPDGAEQNAGSDPADPFSIPGQVTSR